MPYDKEIQSLLLDIEEEKEEQAAEEKAEDEAMAIFFDAYFRESLSKEDMGNEWEEEVTKQSYWDDTYYDAGN